MQLSTSMRLISVLLSILHDEITLLGHDTVSNATSFQVNLKDDTTLLQHDHGVAKSLFFPTYYTC